MSWQDDPRGPYIRMHSGRKFYLQTPEWYLPDIAYHAAGVNRYTGGSRYSIGQHMIVGAHMAARFYPEHPDLPAKFLIHDAPESSFGDMASPLKRLCPDYCALLTAADRSMEAWTGLEFVDCPVTRELDTRMWLTERLVVLRDAERAGVDMTEDYIGPLRPFPLSPGELERLFSPWHPSLVEAKYRSEWQRLLPWMEGK